MNMYFESISSKFLLTDELKAINDHAQSTCLFYEGLNPKHPRAKGNIRRRISDNCGF
jgi:hypothetical protein